MKGIFYLFSRTVKNSIREFVKNPGKLVLALLIAFGFASVILSSFFTPAAPSELLRDKQELFAVVLALFVFIFITNTLKGLSSGASFYSMADVNLLFATPISQAKILFYGLLRQAGVSLLVGFFLLFQYANLRNVYGVTLTEMLILLLGYCVAFFCSNLAATAIYSFTSGSARARGIVRAVIYAITGALIVYVAGSAYLGQPETPLLEGAVSAANSLPVYLFPIAGWLTAAAAGAASGQLLPVIAGAAATALLIGALLWLIIRHNADFYEDVLKVTEVSFTVITAKKEGKMSEALPKNVKVGKTGIGKGRGASAFYYKHLVEDRRGKIFLFDLNSLIFIAIIIAAAFFMKEAGMIGIFAMATYVHFFTVALGRWAKELLFPYVYLVPEPAFRKLIMISLENIRKIALEAVAIFIPVGVILSLGPADILFVIIARIGFGVLFMAGNFLVERLFGSVSSKVLILIFYFMALILIAIPGVILAVMIGVALPGTGCLPLLVTAVWNIPVSLLIAFACRNMLDNAEVNNR